MEGQIWPLGLVFATCALGDISVKILPCGISEILLPMFSPRTFMVSQLIFKSFILLEFVFVYGINWWSSFIFLACSCPDLPTPFVEEAIFTPFYASALFVECYLTIETWVYFWALYSILFAYVSVLMPVPYCFNYSGLVV